MQNKTWCPFSTIILIYSTKPPQLCNKLQPGSLRSMCCLLRLWHLSWRPSWWKRAQLIDFLFSPWDIVVKKYYKFWVGGRDPCRGSFVLEVFRKTTTQQQLLKKTWPSQWNAIFTSFYNHLLCCNVGRMLLHLSADRCGTTDWQERRRVSFRGTV